MSLDMKRLAAGVHDYLARAFAPVTARLNALEARINLLEAREAKSMADAWAGAWLPGHYKRGSLVTKSGHLWLCVESGTGKPGDSTTWKMIVRGGRDA